MLTKVLLAVVALGAVTGLTVLGAVLISEYGGWTPEKSDCIVVLGARVWMDGTMSNALTYRCEAALEAWRAGVAPNIIVSGGQGADEPSPEALPMRQWLLDHGVPGEWVIAETDSLNTQQNLANARAIMEQNGWKTCAVCTSGYHLRRALWLARDEGLSATGIAARSTSDPVSVIRGRVRETCSWRLYFFRKVF